MKPYSNIAELIESLEDEIKAKEFVRAQAVMSDRGSLFSSGDVSRLIKDGAGDVSPALLAIARKVVHMKKKSGSNR
jgi:hypothetical protein